MFTWCLICNITAAPVVCLLLPRRFKRRVVYRFGDWKAEFLQDFDVRRLMREVTLDGPDAQLAFDGYMGEVSRLSSSLQVHLGFFTFLGGACSTSFVRA
jgi:hypothetical protein